MKKLFCLILLISMAVSGFERELQSEQTQKDMFASVVVLPTFKLSLDNANINFGYTEPGKSVELYPHTHYNEVKCISNKGVTWYLKLSTIGDIVGPPDSGVSLDSFKWMGTRPIGDGVIEKGWHSLSQLPTLVYTSGSMDLAGEEVTIQFKYKLDMPPKAKGGNYSVNVLYTMTDMP